MRQATNNIARYVLMLFVLALAPRLSGGVVAAENETKTVTLDGDGTSTNPYKIGNYAQLLEFAALVNGEQTSICAVLTEDINTGNNFIIDGYGELTNIPEKHWTPIGNSTSTRYTGTFNGQGHTISGLYVNENSIQSVGLFGYLDEGGIIRNVSVKGSYFNNGNQFDYIGGVCGKNNKGTIENCYNEGTTVSGPGNYIGGVCGSNTEGTIENCYNTGNVSGQGLFIGGVCGLNTDGIIENCYNAGKVIKPGDFISDIGGVCGRNDEGTIENCYNTGNVSGQGNYTGGVCGCNMANSTIENCYFLEGTATVGIGMDMTSSSSSVTEIQESIFMSGKVAWLLNGNKDDNAKTSPWLQDLSEEENGGDRFPVLKAKDGNCIAVIKKVTDTDVKYTNPDDHSYDNLTFADFPDDGTANLYSHVCDYCKGAAQEDKKEIRKLNSADDKIVITQNNGSDWTTSADITLGDDATNNWYHAPVAFTTTGTVTHTRAISTDWVTLCLPYEISTTNANCKVYKLSNVVPSEKITLTEITEATIEAGTPVFVKRNDNNVNSIEITANNTEMIQTPTEQTADNGKLVGTFNTMTLTMDDNGDCLFIKNDNMWSVTQANKDMTVKPFRAYIVPDTPISAPKLSITIDGEATAISDALDTLNDTNAEYYDINGRRISSLQKGVNIIKSGNRTRKVIIK